MPILKVSESHLSPAQVRPCIFRLQGLLIDSLRNDCDTWYSFAFIINVYDFKQHNFKYQIMLHVLKTMFIPLATQAQHS